LQGKKKSADEEENEGSVEEDPDEEPNEKVTSYILGLKFYHLANIITVRWLPRTQMLPCI
jgi:hypothetical protein